MMSDKYLDEAKKPENIKKLLDKTNNLNGPPSSEMAWNYLVDYLEEPSWFQSHEGQRLLMLSIMILEELAER